MAMSAPSAPDVVVLNVDDPELASARNRAVLHASVPAARLIALTEGDNELGLEGVFAARFDGLLSVSASSEFLARVIRVVACGKVYVSTRRWL